jgi:hypothetical protein
VTDEAVNTDEAKDNEANEAEADEADEADVNDESKNPQCRDEVKVAETANDPTIRQGE